MGVLFSLSALGQHRQRSADVFAIETVGIVIKELLRSNAWFAFDAKRVDYKISF